MWRQACLACARDCSTDRRARITGAAAPVAGNEPGLRDKKMRNPLKLPVRRPFWTFEAATA